MRTVKAYTLTVHVIFRPFVTFAIDKLKTGAYICLVNFFMGLRRLAGM